MKGKASIFLSLRFWIRLVVGSILLQHPTFALAKKKVVLFYIGVAPQGMAVKNGHVAAVEAMKEQIEKDSASKGEEVEIITKNINDFSNFSPELLLRMEEEYIKKIKESPEQYTEEYKRIVVARREMDPMLFETNLNLDKLAGFLEEEKADVAIGAHWLVPLALTQIKQNNRIPNTKTGWIFTDYFYNSLLAQISKGIDMTFLGAKALEEKFLKDGVPRDQLWTSGIPISPKALESIDQKAFKQDKGLDAGEDVVTITLAGGSEGIGDFPTIVSQIREKFQGKRKVQVVVITAKNEKHFKELTAMQEKWGAGDGGFSLKIEKTVPNEDMLGYVKSSDLYIVKSGGLSPTEGAVIGVPMILLDVLGGHEKDNAEFYGKIGIGVVNSEPGKIGEQILDLFDEKTGPAKIQAMRKAQDQFSRDRKFHGVSTFSLGVKRPQSLSQLAGSFPRRSKERRSLIKELGLGSRDELAFLRQGQNWLHEAEKNRKEKKPYLAAVNLGLAKEAFQAALTINPLDYAAHFMMAHYYSLVDKPEKAITSLETSLQYDRTYGHEGQYYFLSLAKLKSEGPLKLLMELKNSLENSDKDHRKKTKDLLSELFSSGQIIPGMLGDEAQRGACMGGDSCKTFLKEEDLLKNVIKIFNEMGKEEETGTSRDKTELSKGLQALFCNFKKFLANCYNLLPDEVFKIALEPSRMNCQ